MPHTAMKRIVAALLVLAFCLPAQASAPAPDVAFVDVNLVPMDRERVLPHQTVLVRAGVIAALGPVGDVALPADAQRIDGHGTAYVLPGLADMHTHVESPDDAVLYLANGVTTVLQMGSDRVLPARRIKASIADGAMAPQAFFALMVDGPSPLGGGWPVTSGAEARAAVTMARAFGYDFIKVYNGLGASEFDALVRAARKEGLAVIGHGVRSVGLPAGLFKGQVMVAHAEEFYYTAFNNRGDEAAIASVVEKTFESRAFVTPNLSTFEVITRQWGKPEQVAALLHDHNMEYVSPAVRVDLVDRDYGRRTGDLTPMLEFLRHFTKALSDRGVPLLAGTDSPAIPGMLPGFSIHEDLRTLQEAGLSPFQALSAATRTPGEFIARTVPGANKFCVVARGARADLLLVSDNPLQSLDTLRKPVGIMYGGRWKPAEDFQAVLAATRTRYASALRELISGQSPALPP